MPQLELQAVRRVLFFSAHEAAVMIGMVDEKTWLGWENGDQPIPEQVAMRIGALLDWRKAHLAQARESMGINATQHVRALWYESMDDWCSLEEHDPIAWRPEQSINATLLEEFPSRIELIAFDMRKYAAWIKGRKDSMHLRAQWLTEVAWASELISITRDFLIENGILDQPIRRHKGNTYYFDKSEIYSLDNESKLFPYEGRINHIFTVILRS